MAKSPGHEQWPNHQVREKHLTQPTSVQIDGDVIAQSLDVVRVDEDGQPPRLYFARQDVRKEVLRRSDTTTLCPFKGTARYYDLVHDDEVLKDAVWTYETPYDEHADLSERLAFDTDKYPQIQIRIEDAATASIT